MDLPLLKYDITTIFYSHDTCVLLQIGKLHIVILIIQQQQRYPRHSLSFRFEDIGRAGADAVIIVLDSPDHHRVAADGDGPPKQITRRAVAGGDLFHLPPVVSTALIALKDIGSTGVTVDVIVLVSPDHHRVAADGDGNTQTNTRRAVGGGDLFHLPPVVSTALIAIENIG